MVMYRHGIQLLPIEQLAYELGLTVPEEDAWLFDKVRTGKKPSSGWGTQIQNPRYEINSVLTKLGIPLTVSIRTDFASAEDLRQHLQVISDQDLDALLCFDYPKLWDLEGKGGHVCVYDQTEDDKVWMVDPERNVPKHRSATFDKLFAAIDFHGSHNATGVWTIKKKD